MIFLTVGTQLPFDRLVEALDRWAGDHPESKVVAQVGESQLRCSHLEVVPDLLPQEYEDLIERCTHVVAHAGTGSILTALLHKKPLLIVPRDVERGEVRSDHQVHTVRAFEGIPGVTVAHRIEELSARLDELLQQPSPLEPFEDRGPEGAPGANLPLAIREEVEKARVRSAWPGVSARVLCASSTGGHLSEMQQLLPALRDKDLILLTSRAGDAGSVPGHRHHAVREASRWSRTKGLATFLQVLWAVLRFRPDVVLSTGAAPGFFAAVAGRILGSRVIWVDSLANVSEVSLAGRLAQRFAHAFFVQWADLADANRRFSGRLIPPPEPPARPGSPRGPEATASPDRAERSPETPASPVVFLTVGVQLPHERLVRELDRWAAATGTPVVAQIGDCAYRPRSFLKVHGALDERSYRGVLDECTHVVAHAGVGTILSARDCGKPLLVVPRIAALGEHRSDHQQATARKLVGVPGVRVCDDLARLDSEMEALLASPPLRPDSASTSLAALLRGLESFTARGRVED